MEAAGLDPRKVEDFVDQFQQAVGRLLDGLQIVAQDGRQLFIQGQIGHAHDGVHGRAQLVAHVGQELALGDVRGFGRSLRLLQVLLHLRRAAISERRAWLAAANSSACFCCVMSTTAARHTRPCPEPSWAAIPFTSASIVLPSQRSLTSQVCWVSVASTAAQKSANAARCSVATNWLNRFWITVLRSRPRRAAPARLTSRIRPS